ncbi:MAG: alpha/beta fold hydrolase [Nitrosomonas ureae]
MNKVSSNAGHQYNKPYRANLIWQIIVIFWFGLITTQVMAKPSYVVGQVMPLSTDISCGSLNDNDQMICNDSNTQRSFILDKGIQIPLNPLRGTTKTWAYDINNSGQVVGDSDFHAVLWSRGVPIDIFQLGGEIVGAAYGINNQGKIVGSFGRHRADDTNHEYMESYAYFSDGRSIRNLAPHSHHSGAHLINDNDQILGEIWTDSVLWENLYPVILASNSGNSSIHFHSINNVGQIVASKYEHQTYEGFCMLWTPVGNGQYREIKITTFSAGCSCRKCINDSGQVVGISLSGAFLWTERDGLLTLNTLVEDARGLTFNEAVSINNKSHILTRYRSSSGQAGYVVLQPKPTVETLELKAEDDRGKVWANGREQAELIATVTDEKGNLAVGRQVWLIADQVDGLMIKPDTGIATTDANGEAKFTVTSKKKGTITFTATDVQNQLLQNSKQIEFAERRVVVFVQGINSELTATNDALIFSAMRDNFSALGFSRPSKGMPETSKPGACANTSDDDLDRIVNDGCPLILNYSYNGGTTDSSSGVWKPFSYTKTDTSHSLAMSYTFLATLIDSFRSQNPNTRFILLGHSQGGLIAFQATRYFLTDPRKFPIDAIITLDAFLGGAPLFEAELAQIFTPWGFPAAADMRAIWYTTNQHDQQGGSARILWNSNNEITKQAQLNGMKIMTVGSSDDCVSNPGKCLMLGHNNTSTQIIESANAKPLLNLGGNCPLACVNQSHSKVLSDSEVRMMVNTFLIENNLLPFK